MNTEAWLKYLKGVSFAYPWALLLLLILPLWAYLRGRAGPVAAVRYSSTQILKEVSRQTHCNFGQRLLTLRYLALVLIIVALARPRHEQGFTDEKAIGIDIMMVLDFSNSMRTRDFPLDGKNVERLKALGKVVNDFIAKRTGDRIGIIGFCKDPYLISPLTLDREWASSCLNDRVDHMKTDGGTAVGEGMAAAAKHLRDSSGKAKIQIVVTDGINNAGVSPLESAKLAKELGIRVYTIRMLSFHKMGTSKIESNPMSQIAKITGGQFFQAADTEGLKSIYKQIDRLEKTEFKQKKFRVYDELFKWFSIPALLLLSMEMVLGHTVWMRLP
jgi:Ca-activated chloride channel homolog